MSELNKSNEFLAQNIPNMSENMVIEFMKISNDLSKVHNHNYTAERVICTFLELCDFYEKIYSVRVNDSSGIPDSSFKRPLESVQEHQ